MRMQQYYYIFTFLLCSLWISVQADITSPTAGGWMLTSYTNGTPDDTIYHFCSPLAGGASATGSLLATPSAAGTYNFDWFALDQTTSTYTLINSQAASASSTLSSLGTGGYKVVLTDLSGNFVEEFIAWIFIAEMDVSIDPITSGCGPLTLNGNINPLEDFTYQDPPISDFEVDANTEITVCFEATHTYVSDLGFVLYGPPSCGNPGIVLSPDPAKLGLSSVCNAGDDVDNLCFKSTLGSTFDVCAAGTPLTGNFGFNPGTYGSYPTGVISDFYGCDATNGGWTVQIFDCISGDFGELTRASISFYDPTVTSGPNTITYDSGPISSNISDNSCNSTDASKFTVPFLVYNETTFDYINPSLSNFEWTSDNPAIVIPNPTTSLTPTISPAPTVDTWFYLTATDVFGCTHVDSVFFDYEPIILDDFTVTPVSCSGTNNGEIEITEPWAFEYSIDGGTTWQTSNIFTGLAAGNYTVVAQDASGTCQDQAIITVQNPSPMSLLVDTFGTTCFNTCDGSVVVGVVGGNAPFSYSWSTGGGNVGFQVNLCIGNYNVTVEDASGCVKDTFFTIASPPELTFGITETPTSCLVPDGSIEITGLAGGVPPYAYTWSANAATGNNPLASPLDMGDYSFTITDDRGCDTTMDIRLEALNQPQTSFVYGTDSVICHGSDALLEATVTGGTPPYTYDWQNTWVGPGLHNHQTFSDTCFYLTVIDDAGCSSFIDSFCVTVLDPLQINAIEDLKICPQKAVTLSAIGSGGHPDSTTIITWQPDNVESDIYTFTPVGNYPDTVKMFGVLSDGCSLSDTDYVNIVFLEAPDVALDAIDTFGCQPVTSTFINESTGGVSCIWDFGDGTTALGCDTTFHTYSYYGTYDVSLSVASANGCVVSDTLFDEINVDSVPRVYFEYSPNPATILNPIIQFNDLSQGIDIVTWDWIFYDNMNEGQILDSSSEINPLINYEEFMEEGGPFSYYQNEQGMYPVYLEVTGANDCSSDTIIELQLGYESIVHVPNTFTPNGDGYNDFFFPKGVGIFTSEEYLFQIWNRDGQKVYESSVLEEPWDGTAQTKNGTKRLCQDIYVWKLQFRDVAKKLRFMRGHVLLMP